MMSDAHIITENSIKSLVEKDAGAFSEYTHQALEKLEVLYPQIQDLKKLLVAYRTGLIKEKI